MRIMLIDGLNYIFRSLVVLYTAPTVGWGEQPSPNVVIENTFKNLRFTVDSLRPDRVYFVLEGHPQFRYDLLPSYKANRTPDDSKKEMMAKFFAQKELVISLLSDYLPISVIKHNDYEADDLIYTMVKSFPQDECIIISGDSDFIQVLDECKNTCIYNSIKKEFVKKCEYDYVTWKSLRGDKTDNIKGIPKVGEVTALKLMKNKEAFDALLSDPIKKDIFDRNVSLIKFRLISSNEMTNLSISNPKFDIDSLFDKFKELEFSNSFFTSY